MKILPLILAAAAGPLAAGALLPGSTEPRPFTDALAHTFSADVRAADERLWEMRRELAMLPNLRHSRQVPRYGFQSQPVFNPGTPQWLQLQLPRPTRIDAIVLVPVDLSAPSVQDEGYGFPRRFKVEAGMREDLSDAVMVVDETARDVPNPQRSALIYDFEPIEVQFIRITSTKHWPTMDQDRFVWALGEVMVMSENY
ncbi:MAG: discoidin domain-containing protein, partial [Akkermansiaceae bacterium]|nr:discoidin domain-containing protein [Akkermansiaceae bacterium]